MTVDLHPRTAPAPASARRHPAPLPPDPVAGSPRHGRGFWLVAAAFAVALAFSTVPTPLYPLLQTAVGFSTLTVTVVFAVYAVGVAVGLVLVGHLSDTWGRRTLLVPALALELVAAGLFLLPPSLPVLLVARALTGLGVGALTAAATAHLAELHAAHRPGASRRRFELVSTAANLGGLGLGTLVSGALATWAPAPLRTPYAVFAVLLVAALVAVLATPETVRVVRPRPAYRPQRVRADHGGRAVFALAAGGAFAAFAVFGLSTSLAPGLVAAALGHAAPGVAGVVVAVVFVAAATAQVLAVRLVPTRRTVAGALVEAVGLALLVLAVQTGSVGVLVVAAVPAGAGAGAVFSAAVATVSAAADAAHRGEALAALFLSAYLGLVVPALAMGLATLVVPLPAVVTGFAVAVAALLALVVVGGRAVRR